MSTIADSGPILSFARANRLELLHQVTSDLTIPDAVYEDIVVRGNRAPRRYKAHRGFTASPYMTARSLISCP